MLKVPLISILKSKFQSSRQDMSIISLLYLCTQSSNDDSLLLMMCMFSLLSQLKNLVFLWYNLRNDAQFCYMSRAWSTVGCSMQIIHIQEAKAWVCEWFSRNSWVERLCTRRAEMSVLLLLIDSEKNQH